MMTQEMTPEHEFWDSIRQALLTQLDEDFPGEEKTVSQGGTMSKQEQQPKDKNIYDRIRREGRERRERARAAQLPGELERRLGMVPGELERRLGMGGGK